MEETRRPAKRADERPSDLLDAEEVHGRERSPAERRVAPPRVQVKSEATCPLCLEPLTALPRLEVCGGCRTIHHAGCVDEFGRCGTPGCHGLTRQAGPPAAGVLDQNERAVAAVAHLSNLLGAAVIMPLGLYLLTRDRQTFAAHHAWRALIFSLASIPLTLVTLGLWVPVMIVLTLRAAVRAWRGEHVPYGRREPPSPSSLPSAVASRPAAPTKPDAKA